MCVSTTFIKGFIRCNALFLYKKLFYKKVSLNIGENLRKSSKIVRLRIRILTRNLRKYKTEIRQITPLDTNFIKI